MLLSQQENWGSVPSSLAPEAAFLSLYHIISKDLNTSPLTEGYSIHHALSEGLYLNTLSSSLSGTSGGKLNPPPAPPARSPTTELSSRSQQAPAWTQTQQPGGQLRNGILHIIGERGCQRGNGFPWLRDGGAVSQPTVLSFQGVCFTRTGGSL